MQSGSPSGLEPNGVDLRLCLPIANGLPAAGR